MHSENFERFFSYYHKMIQSLENFFVSNKRDLLHFRFPVDRLLPKTRSFILKLSKRGELLDFPKKKNGWHAILHFQRSAEESKEKFIHLLQTFDYPITQRIPFSSRNFGEVFFLLSLPFCFNEKIDSLVHLSCINITLVESWMEFTATARRMRASPRFRSTLLASFFLLAVFFLTFWNRHGAERGSLTKVGNHTHRFHAIPVRSTRLQGGQVGRARVFLPFRGGTPRKYSRRSSLSRRMRMIDGTGNIFPLFHR